MGNSNSFMPLPVFPVSVCQRTGSDGIGRRFGAPFASIQAALAAAQTGDTVQIFPGTYTGSIILRTLINLHFFAGANIESDDDGPIFTDDGDTVVCVITGQGRFLYEGLDDGENARGILRLTDNGSEVYFEALSFEAASGDDTTMILVYSAAGQLILFVDFITAGATAGCVKIVGGTCDIRSVEIFNTLGPAVESATAVSNIRAQRIYSASGPAVIGGGSLDIDGARIQNAGLLAGDCPVKLTAAGVKIRNCELIVTATAVLAGATSIDADTALTVTCHNVASNADVDANVTVAGPSFELGAP